jgi:hypothetical protein
MNSRPLEMRPDNTTQGEQSRRVQHGNLLGRFTKLRPGFNPIVHHHLSYHIIYQIYIRNDVGRSKMYSPTASLLELDPSTLFPAFLPKLKKGPWK